MTLEFPALEFARPNRIRPTNVAFELDFSFQSNSTCFPAVFVPNFCGPIETSDCKNSMAKRNKCCSASIKSNCICIWFILYQLQYQRYLVNWLRVAFVMDELLVVRMRFVDLYHILRVWHDVVSIFVVSKCYKYYVMTLHVYRSNFLCGNAATFAKNYFSPHEPMSAGMGFWLPNSHLYSKFCLFNIVYSNEHGF